MMFEWSVIVGMAGLICWLFWSLRVARFQSWIGTHAVHYLIESEELTEQQYYEALHMAEVRCNELGRLGLLKWRADK